MPVRPFRETDRQSLIKLWQDQDLTRPWNDPNADIDRALHEEHCDILVFDHAAQGLGGSVMVTWDGHRGWVYYLAVADNIQDAGWGRRLMRAAEDQVVAWGGHKLQLMVRAGNHDVTAFYTKIGYRSEDRVVMSRWLEKDTTPYQITLERTYLAMERPTPIPEPIAPQLNENVELKVLKRTTLSFYRYLYNTVGENWLWYERRLMKDETLKPLLDNEAIEILLLTVDGTPAGFAEIDFRKAPASADLAYFGLIPDFIGKKLGPYLLMAAQEHAWNHPSNIKKLTVNTCTLDHPSAIGLYEGCGFIRVADEQEKISDPRARGLLPDHILTPNEKRQKSDDAV